MSAVVQLAFGSFGDIVALLQLIAELCTALQAARDSSDDIRALVDDLRAFSCAIDEVKIALERRHMALRPGLLIGITSAVSLCHTMLLDVQRRIDKFHQRRLRSIGPLSWGKYLAAVAWAICGEKRAVATLRQRMWEQLGLVHTMLAIAQINNQDGLASALQSQKASLLQLHQSIGELHYLSDGYPPFFFLDKDGGRFKPALRMAFDDFRSLLGLHSPSEASKLSIPLHSNGGPVFKLMLEYSAPRPDVPGPGQCEMHWIYHRVATSGQFMVFLGLPCIRRDPDAYTITQLLLEKVHKVTIFPHSPNESGYHATEEPSGETGLIPLMRFLYPISLSADLAGPCPLMREVILDLNPAFEGGLSTLLDHVDASDLILLWLIRKPGLFDIPRFRSCSSYQLLIDIFRIM